MACLGVFRSQQRILWAEQAFGVWRQQVRVAGLGDFLEVEYVHAEKNETVDAQAVARIRAFLADAGIPPGRVERRPYMELLRGEGPSA